MPDYTVKADVDTMLRANDKAGIRSAIGVGQTDAPTFLAQTLTGQSLTGTQATSLVDLSATWNTTGTPTAIKLNVVETGINSNAASLLMDLQVSGVSAAKVTKNGLISIADAFASGGFVFRPGNGNGGGIGMLSGVIGVWAGSDAAIGFSSGAALGGSVRLSLYADAAGILAQRNGSAAQSLRIYNTYTDASNYERLDISWASNTVFIRTAKLGTGQNRDMAITAGADLYLGSSNTDRWRLNTTGHFIAQADNTYDIGASGANRPRNVYVGSSIVTPGATLGGGSGVVVGGSFDINWAGNKSSIYGGGTDGHIRLTNYAGTDFGRLQLGGTTDAFPAIARDGAGIKFTGAAAGSTSWIKVPAVAVASLPSAVTAGVGARAFVNDALAPTFGSAVTGGGAVTVPVYSTGSAWNVG